MLGDCKIVDRSAENNSFKTFQQNKRCNYECKYKRKKVLQDYDLEVNSPASIKELTAKEAFHKNFQGYILAQKNLDRAYFPYCDFRFCDLSQSRMQKAILSNSKFSGANLFQADLENASFLFASLVKANFMGANLTRANLRYANLQNANLQQALIVETDFHGADLKGVDFGRATIKKANFYRARNLNLTGANLDLLSIDIDGLPCLR